MRSSTRFMAALRGALRPGGRGWGAAAALGGRPAVRWARPRARPRAAAHGLALDRRRAERGEEDGVRPRRRGADEAEDLEAFRAAARAERKVGDDEVVAGVGDERLGLFELARRVDAPAELREVAFQGEKDGFFVVDDEELLHGGQP